jgi:hypothetical protein
MSKNYIPKELIKYYVYQPPLLNNLHQLKNRITDAAAMVTPDVLQGIWKMMDY